MGKVLLMIWIGAVDSQTMTTTMFETMDGCNYAKKVILKTWKPLLAVGTYGDLVKHTKCIDLERK